MNRAKKEGLWLYKKYVIALLVWICFLHLVEMQEKRYIIAYQKGS
jgi:hypothetical protein